MIIRICANIQSIKCFVLQAEIEDEMRRLRQELKHTMGMYNAACREALAAKEKVKLLSESTDISETLVLKICHGHFLNIEICPRLPRLVSGSPMRPIKLKKASRPKRRH